MKFRHFFAVRTAAIVLCGLAWVNCAWAREYRPDELIVSDPISAPSAIPTSTAAPTPTVAPTPIVAPTPKVESAVKKPALAIPAGKTPNFQRPLRDIARDLKLPLPLPRGRIVISKAARQLELFDGTRLIKRYRVALGSNPRGPKQRRGDDRTPEGRFTICTRNNRTSAFHIFLGLSYPDVPDIERGLRQGKISPREYQLSRRRLASRSAPLWETRLGGWVGIHGGDDAAFARRRRAQRGRADWTAGCIALSNAQIEEVFAATRLGTSVEIRP